MRRFVAMLAAFILAVAWTPGDAQAYHLWDHNNVTTDAVLVPPLDGSRALTDHVGLIAGGAVHEDQKDHIFDYTCSLIPAPGDVGWCWCPHFWDADGDDGNGSGGPFDEVHCVLLTGLDCYPNAMTKASVLMAQAVALYRSGDQSNAYERLGHAAHLLADMTVPGHAHEDFADTTDSGHDDYEAWVKTTAGHPGVAIPAGPVVIPSVAELRARIAELHATGAATIPDEMLTWSDRGLKLYYLFYTANQHADYFDSPDSRGDSVEPYGWVDYSTFPKTAAGAPDRYPSYPTMASNLWSYAVAATGSLYRVFLDEVGLFQPTISSFAPGQGSPGSVVTITGTAFTDVLSVAVGGEPAAFTVQSATTIRATIPVGVARGAISVAVPGGTATSTSEFVVTMAPSIGSISPASGRVGTTVTVTGTGLGYARSVTIGGVAAAFSVRSPTTLVATVPAGARTGPIGAITPFGSATSGLKFFVLP